MFRLGAGDFYQMGKSLSTIAWRSDGEQGLDVTTVPCEGRFVLSFTDRKPTPFHINSVHTFLQRVEMSGYVFESDNLEPLVFRVDTEGYTWVRGKGNVTIPASVEGQAETPVQSSGVTVLPDRRTFLLPPGRQTADLALPRQITVGQRFSVCGEQLEVASINRNPAVTAAGSDSILLRLAKASTISPFGEVNRVSIALVDANGQRFKPTAPNPLSWHNLTIEPGIIIDVPQGLSPVWLEVEGILFGVQSIVTLQAK